MLKIILFILFVYSHMQEINFQFILIVTHKNLTIACKNEFINIFIMIICKNVTIKG